jgi:hypothetical protein
MELLMFVKIKMERRELSLLFYILFGCVKDPKYKSRRIMFIKQWHDFL